jgi:hypothetical protein
MFRAQARTRRISDSSSDGVELGRVPPESAGRIGFPACGGATVPGMALIKFGEAEERVNESAEDVLRLCAQAEVGITIGGRRVSPSGWINLTATELANDGLGSDRIYVQVSSIAWVREST